MESGNLVSWGSLSEGVLGYYFHVDENNPDVYMDDQVEEGSVIIPQIVPSSANIRFISIDSGDFHNLALNRDGEIYGWGRTANGRTGTMNPTDAQLYPEKIHTDETRFIQISCGNHHNLALDFDGYVYSWGSGYSHQLGHASQGDEGEPKLIKHTKAKPCKDISAGYRHSMAVSVEGEILTWGTGDEGQLGRGTSSMVQKPQVILSTEKFMKVIAGEYNSAAISESGQFYIWGNNSFGQLCNGKSGSKNRTKPKCIEHELFQDKEFVSGAIGRYHVLALTSEGELYFWGRDLIDPKKCYTEPIQIEIPPVQKVKTSKSHILAISEQKIFMWGIGSHGQLGKESMFFTETPIGCDHIETVVDISCGSNHSLALLSDITTCSNLITKHILYEQSFTEL